MGYFEARKKNVYQSLLPIHKTNILGSNSVVNSDSAGSASFGVTFLFALFAGLFLAQRCFWF